MANMPNGAASTVIPSDGRGCPRFSERFMMPSAGERAKDMTRLPVVVRYVRKEARIAGVAMQSL